MDRSARLFFHGINIVVLTFLISCAQRVGITGGEKDIAPPSLENSLPDTFSTNFSSDNIRLNFNEFVKLDNVKKNLLVTPLLRYDPDVLSNGKKVIIKNLDDSLWPNTTYVLEFNEAIKDITEGNAAKGFRYVFSTGDYVDSLMVEGEIKDAFTLAPAPDVFAFLYEEAGDSVPYLKKPRYIGRTNKEGKFLIRNLKEGDYRVFMSSDDNKNYLFDRPSERIDFLDKTIHVSADSMPFITGRIFEEDNGLQYLEGFGPINEWAFYLSFKRKVDTLFVSAAENTEFPEASFARSYNSDRDSVVFWLKDSTRISDKWNIYVKADELTQDTVAITFNEMKNPEKFSFKNNLKGGKLDLGNDLELYFEFPVIDIDMEKIHLYKDSILLTTDIKVNISARKLTLKTNWEEKSNYRLSLDSSAFTDVYNLSNDSLIKTFSTQEISNYGTLDISLLGVEKGNGILSILTKNGNIERQVNLQDENKYFFENIYPGEYLLKYIQDDNGNGKWDPGNYLKKKHAEKVFIYQGSITVRSNWDQVIEWKFK